MQPLEFLYLNPQPADLTIVLPVVFLERSLYISVIVPFIASIILLLYLAMSAVTSAEAVAMDRSELTEDVSMLAVPELVTRGDDWVLVTRVMVEVDGLCVISFCWTVDEFHMTRCTAGAVSFGKSSLCFFARLPVLVVDMIPTVGVWEDEQVRTGISGGDWLPAVMDGGALPMTSCLGDGSLGSFLFFRPSRPEWSSPKSMTS